MSPADRQVLVVQLAAPGRILEFAGDTVEDSRVAEGVFSLRLTDGTSYVWPLHRILSIVVVNS